MKELHGAASAAVKASPKRCLELLADVERYPAWYPEVVRRVEALERDDDGSVLAARTSLHAPGVPLVSDISLHLAVTIEPPEHVILTRIAHGPDDPEKFRVTWRVTPTEEGSEIAVSLDANLSVPRMVPVGAIGNNLASGFVTAAARALDPAHAEAGSDR